MPRIKVIKGADKGRSLSLEPGKTVQIGRRSDTDFPLNDSSLSRHHCELLYDGKTAVLVDKGSRHGTLVNDERITKVALEPGDRVRLGATTLVFESKSRQERARGRDPEEDFATVPAEQMPRMSLPGDAGPAKPSRPAGAGHYEAVDSSRAMVRVTQEKAAPKVDEDGLAAVSAEQKRRQLIMTVGAVTAVVALVVLVAFVLVKHFGGDKEVGPVPMEQLTDVGLKVLGTRQILMRPPTYIIDVEVANKSQETISIRASHFTAVDSLGISYAPLRPSGDDDLNKVKLNPEDSIEGSLNYELGMGTELVRLVFQNRGFLIVD